MPIYNDFPPKLAVDWIAADTETHTYIDGVLVSEAQLIALGKTKEQSWFRAHTTVRAYAWLVADSEHFAILESFDEYAHFCAEHAVGSAWWYNAKFDFSAVDYALLTEGWTRATGAGKMRDHEYNSLHSEFGSRYCLKTALEATDKRGRVVVKTTANYDFVNLFKGGLRKILEDFSVTDTNGKPIRKLEMDYQSDEWTPERIAYMRNDVAGLYHAVRIADTYLRDNYGYNLAGRKPSVMTASGLARRVMLRTLYHEADDRKNLWQFKRRHRMTLTEDSWLRKHHLLRGGIAIVNPAYRGKDITTPLWRFDVNSHYPARIAIMPDIRNPAERVTPSEYLRRKKAGLLSGTVPIISISSVHGSIRPGMLPVWYDPVSRDYREIADFDAQRDGTATLFMFACEWEEIETYWYDMDAEIECYYLFRAVDEPGYANFINTEYKNKHDARADGNKVKGEFSKLLMNGAGGKFSENPRRVQTHREISTETGAVVLINDGMEESEDTLLSVLIGAHITALARTRLLQYIRDICDVPAETFIYCDTDSIHALVPYSKTDPLKLGELKDETFVKGIGSVPFQRFKYLAPKSYMEYRRLPDGSEEYEIHTKGVSIKTIREEFSGKDVDYCFRRFSVGEKFQPLSGMNVPGGKALIPIAKYICRPENCNETPDGETIIERGEIEWQQTTSRKP